MKHLLFNPLKGWALLLMTGPFLFLFSCKKDDPNPVDCTGLEPTYTDEIKQILDTSCALSGCHDAATNQSGVNLSTYATAQSISLQDRFLGVIRHDDGFPAMPYNQPKLDEATIQLLTCWVQSGSPQ